MSALHEPHLQAAAVDGPIRRDHVLLVVEAAHTLLPELRRPVLQEVMGIAMTDLPWIPLYVDEDVYVHRADLAWQPRLDNYVIVSELRRR